MEDIFHPGDCSLWRGSENGGTAIGEVRSPGPTAQRPHLCRSPGPTDPPKPPESTVGLELKILSLEAFHERGAQAPPQTYLWEFLGVGGGGLRTISLRASLVLPAYLLPKSLVLTIGILFLERVLKCREHTHFKEHPLPHTQ